MLRRSAAILFAPLLLASFAPTIGGCSGDDAASGVVSSTDAGPDSSPTASDAGTDAATTTSDGSVAASGTLAAAPTTATLAPGQTTTVTLTIGGATTAVPLSVENLPLGVAASFDPPTRKTTSVLTLTAASDVAPSIGSLLVHASALSFDATTNVSLTISAPATAFSLLPVPSALTIAQGSESATELNVARNGSFNGDVTISFPTPPTGISVTPPTLTIPAGASGGAVIVHVALNAPVGTPSLSVHGASGGATADGAIALTIPAPMGGVDTSFATNGASTTSLTLNGAIFLSSSFALQSTGNIIAAGVFQNDSTGEQHGALVRLTPNGALDTTFGTGATGYVLSPNVVNDRFVPLAIQSNDAIVVGFNPSTVAAGAILFPPDGVVDAAFGTSGIATLPMGDAATITLQANQQPLVGGYDNTVTPSPLVIVRLTTSGAIDATFGASGAYRSTIGSSYTVPQGLVSTAAGIVVDAYAYSTMSNVVVLRLLSSGALDTSFGSSGVSTLFAGRNSYSSAVAVDAAGKVLVAGEVDSTTPFVLRLTSAGANDATFGTSGVAVIGGATYLSSIVANTDGTVLVGGQGNPSQGATDFYVARLLATGVLDTTFNGTGVLFGFASPNLPSYGETLIPLADGRFLEAGAVGGSTPGSGIAVMRFYP